MDSGVASLQDYLEKNMPDFDESIREKAS
jgi:hypothetical protein